MTGRAIRTGTVKTLQVREGTGERGGKGGWGGGGHCAAGTMQPHPCPSAPQVLARASGDGGGGGSTLTLDAPK